MRWPMKIHMTNSRGFLGTRIFRKQIRWRLLTFDLYFEWSLVGVVVLFSFVIEPHANFFRVTGVWTEVETEMHEAIVQKDLTRVGKEAIFNYSCQVFKHICLLVGDFQDLWIFRVDAILWNHGNPRPATWQPEVEAKLDSLGAIEVVLMLPKHATTLGSNADEPRLLVQKGGWMKTWLYRWWFQIFIYYVHAYLGNDDN